MAEEFTPIRHAPWNKGKLTGAKPPLQPRHVWAIRSRLLVEGRTRDLALFNLAIDSKLRGCDLVALKVADIAPNGYAIDRVTVRQKKTGRPVKFELTDQTRQAVDDYLEASKQETGRVSIRGAARRRSEHDDASVCPASSRLDGKHWPGFQDLWYPFAAPNKGDVDLPSNRQLAGGPSPIRSCQDREHRQVSWHRSRRCPLDSGANRRLKYPGRTDMFCPIPFGGFVPQTDIGRVIASIGASLKQDRMTPLLTGYFGLPF